MSGPNEALTLSNAAYVAFGAAFAALCSLAANWALKHAEYRRGRSDASSAAEIQAESEERHNFRLAQQSLVEALRNRIADGDKDRVNLWTMFNEMQTSLSQTQRDLRLANDRAADCELLHQADALRIRSLERENETLHARIVALEHKVNGDG
jgi:hypothetical protein